MADALEPRIEVHGARLVRTIESLSYASVDDFESCLALLGSSAKEDEFGEIETAFVFFIEELREAKGALQATLESFESTRRELSAQLATIDLQEDSIRVLSTPIIEVWAGVLCLPIVGIVDSQRSAEMTERLLETVVAKKARLAIIDITGIDVMDTKTADHFVKMAKAVRLLGAECMLSGINPAIARTLTHIGVDLTGIQTLRTVRDGLQIHLQDAPSRARSVAGS